MMIRLFPISFDPQKLTGPRAKSFNKASDLFQQLIGDALRDVYGSAVTALPTLGADGGIDAYVEHSQVVEAEIQLDITPPTIIECKSYESAVTDAVLLQRARQHIDKLQEHASLGWSHLYTPWRKAKTYLYFVSATFSSQQAKDNVKQLFIDFFFREKSVQVERVDVWDWSNIRDWLDRMPRIRDRWLGIGSLLLLGHDQYRASLSGLFSFLLEENLPFIPLPGADFNPDQLLSRVSDLANKRGVLLVGPGGIGKTRITLETAVRAHAAGWRVIHVNDFDVHNGDGALGDINNELKDAALEVGSNTLVVLDYVDRVPLSTAFFRKALFPAAKARNSRLGIIANCRPGALFKRGKELHELFETVHVRPPEAHFDKIASTIVRVAAPSAVRNMSEDRVRELCGVRPILALFVARYLESVAKQQSMNDSVIQRIVSDELLLWLQKRLKESDLLVLPSSTQLIPSSPSCEVVAATAALVALPAMKPNILKAIRTVLATTYGPTKREEHARHLLHRLLENGWIETDGALYRACHDLVVDELFNNVLYTESSRVLRVDTLEQLLESCLSPCPVLTNFVASVDRLFVAADGSSCYLAEAVTAWITKNVSSVYRVLLNDRTSHSAICLGAMLSSPVFNAVAREHFLKPWLTDFGGDREAQHVLYTAIHGGMYHENPWIVAIALSWIEQYGSWQRASFILYALLGVEPSNDTDALITKAAWGWIERHSGSESAHFVLYRLLRRMRLSRSSEGDDELDVTAATMWLRLHGTTPSARFILSEVLLAQNLRGAQEEIFKAAVDWVRCYREQPTCRYVLQALLTRTDLGRYAEPVKDCAREWIDIHLSTAEAGYVIEEFLKRRDATTDEITQLIADASTWLDNWPQHQAAAYVLKKVAERQRFAITTSIADKLAYIKAALREDSTYRAVMSCLSSIAVGHDDGKAVQRLATSWLTEHVASERFSSVLMDLLRRPDLEGDIVNQAAVIYSRRLRNYPKGSNHNRRRKIVRRFVDYAPALSSANKHDLVEATLNWYIAEPTVAIFHLLQLLEPIIDLNTEVGQRVKSVVSNVCAVQDGVQVGAEGVSHAQLSAGLNAARLLITEGFALQVVELLPNYLLPTLATNDEQLLESLRTVLFACTTADLSHNVLGALRNNCIAQFELLGEPYSAQGARLLTAAGIRPPDSIPAGAA